MLDSKNRPIAGVAVSLPNEMVDEAIQEKAIANVKSIATQLSRRMGADLHRAGGSMHG